MPYITHPVSVALILERSGFDEPVCIAGLLQDAVAGGLALGLVADQFGADVARIVVAVNETKHDTTSVAWDWQKRKEALLAQIAAAGPDAVALAVAAALCNVCSTLDEIEQIEDRAWEKIRNPPLLFWYFHQVCTLAVTHLPGHALTSELTTAVAALSQRWEGGL